MTTLTESAQGLRDPQAARVEWYEERRAISTTPDASDALAAVQGWFFSVAAEDAKQRSGLEAIPRRAYELVAKVSTILAAHTGTRTLEHVAYAYALCQRILTLLSGSDGETQGVIVNRLPGRYETTAAGDAVIYGDTE